MKQTHVKKITQRIIDDLGKGGIPPWRKPFSSKMPMNLETKHVFSGANSFIFHPMVSGYQSHLWVTYLGAKALGGHVTPGEKCTWGKIRKTGKDKKTGEPWFSYVSKDYYNIEQCTGIEIPKDRENVTEIVAAEDIVKNMQNPPSIYTSSAGACYVPSLDEVRIPQQKSFVSDEEYYCTLFHELIHSTMHASRLWRVIEGFDSYDHQYSAEELVAEIGAAFLCSMAGIEGVYDNSVSYIKHWHLRLSEEPTILIKSAALAEKAFRYIAGDNDVALCEEATEDKAA
jgi:antirestriction protein ArdC